MLPIREIARAKINLTLRVIGKRPDGYHALESLVAFADVHDVVTLDAGAGRGVSVSGPYASYISGENLLVRALTLLREAEPKLTLGSVHLDKHLPIAAGLGGGSADAAALLRAIRGANPASAARVPWRDIALQLGADVPVCLDSRPALMWGIGDCTAAVRHLPEAHAVLVNPGVPLPTADVFQALTAGPVPATAQPSTPDLHHLDGLLDYMRANGNDLEAPAVRLRPVISEVKAALGAEPNCLLVAMAGSGPTCFGIFSDRAAADRAAERIRGAHADWWVKAAALTGVST